MQDAIALAAIAELDRRIEDAMGRIMNGKADPNDYGLVSDLSARRVEISEPAEFARLDALLADLERGRTVLSLGLRRRGAAADE